MNPLNRKMFRDPRAARRATGILASSAPLMTSAQKAMAQGEPVRAQTGASVNTQNRLFDPAQIMRGVQYPLEYFGMPVPPSAPGVPVGTVYEDIGLNRLMYGTDRQRSPIQSGLRAADTAVRTVTGAIPAAVDAADAALTRGIGYMFTPQYVSGEGEGGLMTEAEPRAAAPGVFPSPAPVPETGLPETGELMGPELAAARAAVPPLSSAEAAAEGEGPAPKPKPKPAASQTDDVVREAKAANKPLESQLAALRGDNGSYFADLGATPDVTQDAVVDFGVKYAEMVTPEEVSLSDIEARAKDIMGFDPEKATEDRKNAFWMGLTRAGLAIAAGESDNALTNVAKGLSFGLDAYAKDISRIDERDQAERREYRDTLRSLIKDEKDASIAQAQMINSYNQSVNALTQNAAIAARSDMTQRQLAEMQDQTRRELAAAQNALASQSLEVQLQSAIARNNIDILRLESDVDYRNKTIENDQAYRTAVLALDEWKSQPELVKVGVSLGYVDDKGEWTIEGHAWATRMATAALAGTSKELQAATAKRFAQDAMKNDELVGKATDEIKDKAKMNREPTLPEIQRYFEAVNEGTTAAYFESLLVENQ